MSDDHITINISQPTSDTKIKVDEELSKYTDNHFIHKLNECRADVDFVELYLLPMLFSNKKYTIFFDFNFF